MITEQAKERCRILAFWEKQRITGTGRITKVKRNKMYILVALDLYSRVGFALGTKSHGSQTMAHFLHLVSMLLKTNARHLKLYYNRNITRLIYLSIARIGGLRLYAY